MMKSGVFLCIKFTKLAYLILKLGNVAFFPPLFLGQQKLKYVGDACEPPSLDA